MSERHTFPKDVKNLIILTLPCVLAACGVKPENSDQKLVLEVIAAAEKDDAQTLGRLTNGAMLPDSMRTFKLTIGDILTPAGCNVSGLFGGGPEYGGAVAVEWSCDYIQGHFVTLIVRNGRIVEVWWSPEE